MKTRKPAASVRRGKFTTFPKCFCPMTNIIGYKAPNHHLKADIHQKSFRTLPCVQNQPQNFLISSHRTVSNSHLQKITACDLQVILNRQEGGFCWLEKQHVAQTYKTRGPEGRRRAGATPCSDKAGGSCLPRSCLRGRSHHQQPREETSIHPQERRFRVVVAAVEREE